MRPTKELFGTWARCRDGAITRVGMLRLLRPIREEVNSLLLRGVFSGNPKLTGMCTRCTTIATGCDLPGRRRGRTHQQRQRTCSAPRGDLAEAVLRHTKRSRQPVCRNNPDGRRNLSPAISQQLPIPHRRHAGPFRRSTHPLTAVRGVNGYQREWTVGTHLGRPRTPDEIRELVVRLAREKLLGLHTNSGRDPQARHHEDLPANGEEDPEGT